MASFSDNFNRSDGAIGANWTNATGGIAILSNQARLTADSFAQNVGVYTGTACATVNQYAKMTLALVGAGSFYPCLMFRYTDADSPLYAVYFWPAEDKAEWCHKTNAADGSPTVIDSVSASGLTVGLTDTVAATIEGTGNDTTVRIWVNPTGDTPTSASVWGGSGPNLTFTANPASAVDTGSYVAIGGETNDPVNSLVDNFFGGDIPTAGGSIVPRSMLLGVG